MTCDTYSIPVAIPTDRTLGPSEIAGRSRKEYLMVGCQSLPEPAKAD